MDDLVKGLTVWGIASLVVMTVISTFFVRRIVEFAWPWLKAQAHANSPEQTYTCRLAEFYNTIILYAIPVTFGAGWAFIDSDFLFGTIGSFGGKLFFSCSVGWFSGFIYKILKKVIVAIFASKFGITYETKDGPKGLPEEV